MSHLSESQRAVIDGGTFKRWEEFVSDSLPWGLGSKPEAVRSILESRKGYRSTQRETVPEPSEPGRGKKKQDHDDTVLSAPTEKRLRAINRAPEIVGKLYDEGLISQVDAAKLGNSRQYIEERLRREFPAIWKAYLNGEY